jgi:hypothetical protein
MIFINGISDSKNNSADWPEMSTFSRSGISSLELTRPINSDPTDSGNASVIIYR